MKDTPKIARDGRGGRQYQLRRVKTTDLAPGLRTVVSEFETAAKVMGMFEEADEWYALMQMEEDDQGERELATKIHDRAKQALIRKLLRMQNGEELTDVEALKKRLRRMARIINQINQVVSAQNLSGDKAEIIRDLLKAQPEALEDVEKIIGKRRPW